MFDSRCQNAGLEWARAATGSDGSRPQCPDHLCYRLSRRANASASDWWRSDLLLAKALRRRGIAWLHSASAGEVWTEERLTPTTLTAAAFVSGAFPRDCGVGRRSIRRGGTETIALRPSSRDSSGAFRRHRRL